MNVRGESFIILFLTLAVAWCACAASSPAEDWPQWRGPERTGHVPPGVWVPKDLPAQPRLIWRVTVGEGFASPVVAAGRIYYCDNQNGKEVLHAAQAEDAKEIWKASVDDSFQDAQGPPGPRCTPVVDAERVYAQSGKGELQCRSSSDGRLRWRVNFTNDFGSAFLGEDSRIPGAAEHGYTAPPLIVGEKLIACVGRTNGAGIVCFAKDNGHILWKSQNDLAAYAAPVLATLIGVTQAVCFTVEGLIGLALDDGHLLWRVPLKTNYGRNCATPVIADDWVIAGSYRAGLVGVKLSRDGTGIKAERKWVNQAFAINFSSPVAIGRYIYGLGPAKNIFCVEIETGKTMWSKEGYINTSSDAHASFLVLGERLLLCSDTGELMLLAVDPAECRQFGRAQVCGRNWCNPAYSAGRLYIRDGLRATGNLFCVDLRP